MYYLQDLTQSFVAVIFGFEVFCSGPTLTIGTDTMNNLFPTFLYKKQRDAALKLDQQCTRPKTRRGASLKMRHRYAFLPDLEEVE
jgi:hypothetical protein